MYKLFGLFTGIILGLIPYSVAVSDTNSASLNNRAQKVTILVAAQQPKSGVIIDRRGNTYFVLTTKHSMSEQGIYFITTPDGDNHRLDYSKVEKLSNLDLAIFQFNSSHNYDFVKFGNVRKINKGDTVYVVGISSAQSSTEVNVATARGQVTELLDRPLDGGYRWIYDSKTEEGMSGGAVLDAQGNVVAIHGQAPGRNIARGNRRTGRLEKGFNLGIPVDIFFQESNFAQSPSIPTPQVATSTPTPQPTPSVVITPKPSPSVTITPQPSSSVVITPQPSPSVVMTPKPSPSVVMTPKPSPSVVITPKPSPSVVITPKPSPSVTIPPQPSPYVVITPKPSPSVVMTPKPSPSVVMTPKPTPTIATGSLPPSPIPMALFVKPPRLVEASTTQDSTSTPGATYYFTVSVPENAGASLSEIQFQQTSGSNFLGYNIEETKGFEGTQNNKNAEVFVSLVDENSETRTIAVRLDPPIVPGKTVTLALRPLRTPASRGVYQLRLTAFPDGNSVRPFSLGFARLNFYNRK